VRDWTLADCTDLIVLIVCVLALFFGLGYYVRDLQARKQIQQAMEAPKPRIVVNKANWGSFNCAELRNICQKREKQTKGM
jgi:hypothetical protein